MPPLWTIQTGESEGAQVTKFIPVLFKMCGTHGSLFDHAGFAFELPGWPEFHAVAHTDNDGRWTATHWESGRNCFPSDGCKTRAEVPDILRARLIMIGRDTVMKTIAPYIG